MESKLDKIKILHVDDEEDTLTVVKTILDKEGYEVVSIKSGTDALDKVNLNGFSLVILDIMMPDMSGWDLFNRIVKIKPNYKIVFLSIIDLTNEKIKELTRLGAIDYIKKPFDRADFVARIKKAINS